MESSEGHVVENIPVEIDENGMTFPLYRGNGLMGPERDPVAIGHVFIAHDTISDLASDAAFTVKTMFGAPRFHDEDDTQHADGDAVILGFFITPDYKEYQSTDSQQD